MQNEQPKRKSPRLYGYDYGNTGVYFLTICTHDKKRILSKIVGEGFPLPHTESHHPNTVGEGSPLPYQSAKVELLYCGKVADKWINRIPEQFKGVSVDCCVIMPNHIHLLLRITKDNVRGSGDPDGRVDPSPTEKAEITTNSVVGWLKYQISKEVLSKYDFKDKKIFQRSYYDHIIRDRDDYYRIYKYIKENPICWQTDILYTE